MNDFRKCWYDPNFKLCFCEDDTKCIRALFEHAKLVYCNDKACKFNMSVPYEFVPDRGMNYKPFKDGVFTGICTRKDLALSPIQAWELKTNRKLTTCRVRSDKSLKRPKFPDPDKIEGGLYDDHSADWSTSAFHV